MDLVEDLDEAFGGRCLCCGLFGFQKVRPDPAVVDCCPGVLLLDCGVFEAGRELCFSALADATYWARASAMMAGWWNSMPNPRWMIGCRKPWKGCKCSIKWLSKNQDGSPRTSVHAD